MSVCVYPSDSSAEAFHQRGMSDRQAHSYAPREAPPYSPTEPSSSSTLPPLRLAISQVSLPGSGRPAALEPPSGPTSAPGPWLPSASSASASRPLHSTDAQYNYRPRDYDAAQMNQIRWNPDQAPRRPSSANSHYIAAPVSRSHQPASPSSTSPHGGPNTTQAASAESPPGGWSYPPSISAPQPR